MTKLILNAEGVLYDSEDVAMRIMDDALTGLIKKHRPTLNLPERFIYHAYVGESNIRVIQNVIEQLDIAPETLRAHFHLPQQGDPVHLLADKLTDKTMDTFRLAYESGDPLLTEVQDAGNAMRVLQNKIGRHNYALTSASRIDRLHFSLQAAVIRGTKSSSGLQDLFSAGELCRSGYRAENRYDEAFDTLCWDTYDTIVVESSVSGLVDALKNRPGLRTIGVVASIYYQHEEILSAAKELTDNGANVAIFRMADLPAVYDWLAADMSSDLPEDIVVYMPDEPTKAPASPPVQQDGPRPV